MKKFTKIALILAAVMVGIGVICLSAAVALGLNFQTLSDMVKEGRFSFGEDDIEMFFKGNSDELREIKEECRKLDIELDAGTLWVYYDDIEQIQVGQEDVSAFQCYVEEDTLHIEGGRKLGMYADDGKITLVLPKGKKFEEADFSIGAGEAKLEGLAAGQVEIEVGAGEADIKNLDTSLLKAETGAGELSVELVGEESDYHYEAECGIGEIQIVERTFGGLGGKQNVQNPGAQRTLELECGVGEIRVTFEK